MQDSKGQWREIARTENGIAYDPAGQAIGSMIDRPVIKITDPVKITLPNGSIIDGMIDGFEGTKLRIHTHKSTRPDFSDETPTRKSIDNHLQVIQENQQLRMMLGAFHYPWHDIDCRPGEGVCVCRTCQIDFMAESVASINARIPRNDVLPPRDSTKGDHAEPA